MSDVYEETLLFAVADQSADQITSTCPKCGHTDLYVQFMPIGKKLWSEEAIACRSFCGSFKKSFSSDATRGIIRTECIYIRCRTCQYDWAEKTIDNEEE